MQLPCPALALLCLLASHVSSAAADQPNVVLIIGDDQAWTDYGFMGHSVIRTPHLDRLAARSACFPRGYVPSSLCRPSLATLLTGRYPHEHRICGNDPPARTDRGELLRHVRRLPTLPKVLGLHGYVSFQTGKWWEGHPSEGGFTAGMSHGDPRRGGRHGDDGLAIGRQGLQPIRDFLNTTGGKPFFLWYAPMLPHTPHNPPERLLAKYRSADRPLPIARYFAMCEWFDETVGELIQILDDQRLTENTVVVYVADNGWIQQPDGNQFAPKSKRSPYDGGLRSPILVSWPARIEAIRCERPASSIDIVPTILNAVGIPVPSDLPGSDLVAESQRPADAPPRTLFGEIFNHDIADIDRPAASLQYRWTLAEGRWKLILPADRSTAAELYDVLADPREETNLADQHPDRVTQLSQTLDTWWTP
jgi:arylsulfatase A-like enzyme